MKKGRFLLPVIDRKYGKPIQQRLEDNRKITEDGHWLWLGYTDRCGYGKISIDGKPLLVHRVAYRFYKEIDLDNDILVLHKPPCVIRNCFNPEHLYLGDQAQNIKDSMEAGHSSRVYRGPRNQKFLESIEKQVMDGFKE